MANENLSALLASFDDEEVDDDNEENDQTFYSAKTDRKFYHRLFLLSY